ncbi:YceI family protein [Acetobacter sp. LMG 32666]|uniref:YceI family protein n=1 Tax=Acetobacter sp. LMG 32666 TaxID=2959295 RepID=UPI0030C86840
MRSGQTVFFFCAAFVGAALTAGAGVAAPQHVVLGPANTQAHLYAKTAVTNIEGSFEQVEGTLTYDPEDQSCHVELSMGVQSLKVGSAVLRSIMLSGIMLDGDDHPNMRFVGECKPTIRQGRPHTVLVGRLSMRGQTHPLSFDVAMHFTGNTLTRIQSDATFDQRQWGVSTLLHAVDPMVRAQTVIDLPSSCPPPAAHP